MHRRGLALAQIDVAMPRRVLLGPNMHTERTRRQVPHFPSSLRIADHTARRREDGDPTRRIGADTAPRRLTDLHQCARQRPAVGNDDLAAQRRTRTSQPQFQHPAGLTEHARRRRMASEFGTDQHRHVGQDDGEPAFAIGLATGHGAEQTVLDADDDRSTTRRPPIGTAHDPVHRQGREFAGVDRQVDLDDRVGDHVRNRRFVAGRIAKPIRAHRETFAQHDPVGTGQDEVLVEARFDIVPHRLHRQQQSRHWSFVRAADRADAQRTGGIGERLWHRHHGLAPLCLDHGVVVARPRRIGWRRPRRADRLHTCLAGLLTFDQEAPHRPTGQDQHGDDERPEQELLHAEHSRRSQCHTGQASSSQNLHPHRRDAARRQHRQQRRDQGPRQQAAQLLDRPMQTHAHGAGRDAEHFGDLCWREAMFELQQQHLPLLDRQPFDVTAQRFDQFAALAGGQRRLGIRDRFATRQLDLAPPRAPFGELLAMQGQDAEQPRQQRP